MAGSRSRVRSTSPSRLTKQTLLRQPLLRTIAQRVSKSTSCRRCWPRFRLRSSLKIINITSTIIIQRGETSWKITSCRSFLSQIRIQANAWKPNTILRKLITLTIRLLRWDTGFCPQYTVTSRQSPCHVVTTQRFELIAEVIKNSLVTKQLATTISPYLLAVFLCSVKESIEISRKGITICIVESVTIWRTSKLSLLACEWLSEKDTQLSTQSLRVTSRNVTIELVVLCVSTKRLRASTSGQITTLPFTLAISKPSTLFKKWTNETAHIIMPSILWPCFSLSCTSLLTTIRRVVSTL